MMDAEFQKALDTAKKKVNAELDEFYFAKHYSGTPKMQREARAKDSEDRQAEFNKKMAEYERQYDALHFPDWGRAALLKIVELDEKKLQYDKNIKEHFEKSALSKDKDRGR